MAILQVYPHKNIVIGRKSTKLRTLGLILWNQTLPKDFNLSGSPKNKYKVSYVCKTKLLTVKPAYVYYLKLEFKDGLTVWKVGYTSMSIRKRVDYFMLDSSTKVTVLEIIKCKNSKEAFKLEQLLHYNFKKSRIYGLDVLASGNTELYKNALM